MKTVLVTGAQGFFGRHCAREFSAKGWKVIGIGLGKWLGEHPADFGIDAWHESKITKEALLSLEYSFDAVVHCAGSGSVGFSLDHPYEDFCMTVETTASVLEYLRSAGSDARLMYPSSAAVYGCLHSGPIGESSDVSPVSPYGVHKLMAEEICRSYARSFGLAVSVIRFFSLYGPGLRKQLLWDACNRITAGERLEFFGTGAEIRDWLHVKDAAALVRCIAETPHAGLLINGGSGRNVTVREVLAQLASSLGSNLHLSFNEIQREGDPKSLAAEISVARQLGWSPCVGLEEGIKEYAAWFKEAMR